MIGSNYRKQFILSGKIDSIIEGIGSAEGLLSSVEWTTGRSNYGVLYCFNQNGKTLYPDTNKTCGAYITGIPDATQAVYSFSVYPNPANRQITLDITLPQELNTGTLELYNSIGKLIKIIVVNTNSNTLTENTSSLTNGIYYYKLITNNSVSLVRKLIIIH